MRNYMAQTQTTKTVAKARMLDLPISPKHSVEISNALRFKSITHAKRVLQGVIDLEKPVRFTRFDQDLGHKPGIGAGRFPQKAATHFLKLVASVEANALHLGLNTSNLKIVKLVSNKGAVPAGGGRIRRTHKRTNLEIEVCEAAPKAAKVAGARAGATAAGTKSKSAPKADSAKK